MMETVPHTISGLGLRKFQADGFLLTRVYNIHPTWTGLVLNPSHCGDRPCTICLNHCTAKSSIQIIFVFLAVCC